MLTAFYVCHTLGEVGMLGPFKIDGALTYARMADLLTTNTLRAPFPKTGRTRT